MVRYESRRRLSLAPVDDYARRVENAHATGRGQDQTVLRSAGRSRSFAPHRELQELAYYMGMVEVVAAAADGDDDAGETMH